MEPRVLELRHSERAVLMFSYSAFGSHVNDIQLSHNCPFTCAPMPMYLPSRLFSFVSFLLFFCEREIVYMKVSHKKTDDFKVMKRKRNVVYNASVSSCIQTAS